jgi:hypothetical protein
MLALPRLKPVAETEQAFYRRRQKHVTVRHVSGDEIAAIVELVSPGNNSSRSALRAFVTKAVELIDMHVHLLIIDLHPPGPRDRQGMHAAIWDALTAEEQSLPADKQLTLAAYECAHSVRAYVVHLAVGDVLQSMPLFLEPGLSVEVPLENTYNTAFSCTPQRWRSVLESP